MALSPVAGLTEFHDHVLHNLLKIVFVSPPQVPTGIGVVQHFRPSISWREERGRIGREGGKGGRREGGKEREGEV